MKDNVKRLFDFSVAASALFVLSLLLLVLAFLVFINLGRPVFFRQLRPGIGGLPFRMVKFRTMSSDIGTDGQPLPDAVRLTPFGRLLRVTSLDELPE